MVPAQPNQIQSHVPTQEVIPEVNMALMRAELSRYPPPSDRSEIDNFDFDHPGTRIEVNRTRKMGKLRQQHEAKRLRQLRADVETVTSEGQTILNAVDVVTPAHLRTYEYAADINDENIGNMRKNGLYGVHGDLTAETMRRGAVTNARQVEPIGARYEFARYLAYDMPHHRDAFMVPRRGDVTAVTDTRLYK